MAQEPTEDWSRLFEGRVAVVADSDGMSGAITVAVWFVRRPGIGRSRAEIAEQMGMSQVHVSRLLRKALRQMGDAHQGAAGS